jgi:hypothetical protein
MKTTKQLKEAERVAGQQREVVLELQALVKDIERCEKTMGDLRDELGTVNQRHANRTTTQDDINYLEDLLACAKKKLVWEKQMASLQKRTPALMLRVETLVNHPESSPDEETRNALMGSLTGVKAAMERLNGAKL